MAEQLHYTYRITWSDEDQEFVGLCVEFSGLSHLDKTEEQALAGIKSLVTSVVADMIADGETPPEALAMKKYSGEFIVRVPPDLHRDLAMQAKEQNVSLNRLVSSKLANQAR